MTRMASITPEAVACVARATTNRQAPPATLVIFGAGGDLTKRLVVPALYNLVRAGRLADGFSIVGIGRGEVTTESWRRDLRAMLDSLAVGGSGEFLAECIDERAWDWLARRMTFLPGDFTRPETYDRVKAFLDEQGARQGRDPNVLFYLAVADRYFGPIIDRLGSAGLTGQTNSAWRRVIIEKPFGHDLASARALNTQIRKILSEDQIYRIDHFLGKETVQNILVLRFANGIFEPLWNRDHINHVQITAAETVGVETRGRFYDVTGALRDMVPNHLFQLLAMIAMEPPTSFSANDVRNKKTDLFCAIRPIGPDDAVCGQYGAGTVLGKPVRDYRHEPNVSPSSTTETYVALKLGIDNWRWAGVPFYLRTGKYLSARTTEIAIQFRQAPYVLFRETPIEALPRNFLKLRIQPDEGLSVTFSAKRPGQEIEIDGVAMDFSYRDYFEPLTAVGYETLLYDCLIGDAMLFQRADTVEAAWCAVQPVLDAWVARPPGDFPNYAAGLRTGGRRSADRTRWTRLAAGRRRSAQERSRMKAGKISLLLADVDGTLVTHDKILTLRAQDAVRSLREAGIRLAITSGRPPKGMPMLIAPLALETPIAGFNGGLFVRPDLSIIEDRTLAPDVAAQTIDLILGHGLDVWVYDGSDWRVRDARAPHVDREAWTVQFPPKVVTDFDSSHDKVVKIVGVSDDHDLVRRCEADAQGRLGDRATAARSQPYYLDVTHRDANKGFVADYLSRTLGIPQAEIATIGDQPNDVLMFRRSGFSIAMGNASDDVKRQASAATDSYDDEGFAKAVERFILR